jgi:hypothetical protein
MMANVLDTFSASAVFVEADAMVAPQPSSTQDPTLMKTFTYLLGSAVFMGSLTAIGCGGAEPVAPKEIDASKSVDLSKTPVYTDLGAPTKAKTRAKK